MVLIQMEPKHSTPNGGEKYTVVGNEAEWQGWECLQENNMPYFDCKCTVLLLFIVWTTNKKPKEAMSAK